MSRRPIWLVGGALGFVLVAIGSVPVTTLVAPYSSRPIPAECSSGLTHIPSDRMLDGPGIGAAWLVAADSEAEVVFGSGSAYLLKLPSQSVLWQQSFASGEISAARQSGTAYVFDDKIGYFLSRPSATLSSRTTIEVYSPQTAPVGSRPTWSTPRSDQARA